MCLFQIIAVQQQDWWDSNRTRSSTLGSHVGWGGGAARPSPPQAPVAASLNLAVAAAALPGAAPRPRSRSSQIPAAATSQLLVCGPPEALAAATFHALVGVGVAGARNSAGGKHIE